MSQQHMLNRNLPNGIQQQFKPQLNGVDSSHSSRDSSPSAHYHQIPTSQLPPSKASSQLPAINHLTQNYANLQVSTAKQVTPISTPQKAVFTSTPLQDLIGNTPKEHNLLQTSSAGINLNNSNVISPILSNPQVSKTNVTAVNSGNNQTLTSLPQTTATIFNHTNLSQNVPLTQQSTMPPKQQPTVTSQQQRLQSYTQNPMNNNLQSSNGFGHHPSQPQQPPQYPQGPSNVRPPMTQPATRGPFTINNQSLASTRQENHLPQMPQSYPSYPTNLQQNAYASVASPAASTSQMKTTVHANRYPQQQQQQSMPPSYNQPPNYQSQSMKTTGYYQPSQQPHQQQQQANYGYQNQVNSVQSGFNTLWGADNFDLLQTPRILPDTVVETPGVNLGNQMLNEANCSPEIFRCTMTKIPETNSLLNKSRLPLGILIHPFKDLHHLAVIQCNAIVRCRACRNYINPFVFFVDNKRWKCNLCYRVNDLPEEFQYDPVSKTYGDPSRRPEVKSSTIEYIAPAEYMLRPPQPAIYLFLLDISRSAIESGYLHTFCNTLSAELNNLPGDSRTHVGFIAFDSALHFFSLAEGLSQPHEMTVLDTDDVFLPCPDNLLVNLQDRMDLVTDLLAQLSNRYNNSYDSVSALGAALQAAHRMMASTGGRVTVFQATLPTQGPGLLLSREDPNQRASADVQHLNPANDFYKRLALECSGQQIAVDLFVLNSHYVDVATLSGICRFSGGCLYHFPLFKAEKPLQNEAFERSLKRYLTRKIGLEAVMRIRCSRGLAIHSFHGNFFVRSTDLLSLPNINPDAGFGMQVSIEESLSDVQTVCFQAALLYTSSKGERRIRVHTMCLPVVSTLSDVINSADQQCIVGLLAKMAVDRSMQSNLTDAREAFINAAIDIVSSYKLAQNLGSGMSGLLLPRCLRLLPLYISAMLKYEAFRIGISTRLDDRVKAMCDMKTKPLSSLIQAIYPDLYPVHNLEECMRVLNEDEEPIPVPPRLQLSARYIDQNGAYIMDMGEHMIMIVGPAISPLFLNQVLGVADYNSISDYFYALPILENEASRRMHAFLNYLNENRSTSATLQVMRENSPLRASFLERLVEDRVESALSYHEFLQHIKTQVK